MTKCRKGFHKTGKGSARHCKKNKPCKHGFHKKKRGTGKGVKCVRTTKK